MNDNLALFIFLRGDMETLRDPGMAAVQSAQAMRDANAQIVEDNAFGDGVKQQYEKWAEEKGTTFGTVLVIEIPSDVEGFIEELQDADIPAGLVHDEKFPLIDGDAKHKVPITTGGWAFGYRMRLNGDLGLFNYPFYSS